MTNQFTRRSLLHRLGGAAAFSSLSTFVPLLEADAKEGMIDGAPMRYLSWYTPVVPFEEFMTQLLPTKESMGKALRFSNEFSVLNEMSSKMSYMRGLTNTLSQPTGSVGIGGGHRQPGFPMLSGWAPGKLQTGDTPLISGSAVGMRGKSTLDNWLVEKLEQHHGIKRPIDRIAMGHRNFAHNTDACWRTISSKKGVLQFNHQSPARLYNQMFKINNGNSAGTPSAGGGEFEQAYQRNVLDASLNSLHSLQGKLSQLDRQRLEQHLDAIREAERQLDIAEAVAAGGGSCTFIDAGNLDLDVPMDEAMSAYIKLLTVAFSCDMSRVAGMYMLSHIGDNSNDDKHINHKYKKKAFHFLPEAQQLNNGDGQDFHHLTHITGETNASAAEKGYLMGAMRWRAEIFTELLKSFDGIVEANGKTLLDNSIIHWFTENTHTHVHHDQFHVIAGGADHFNMGKHLNAGVVDGKYEDLPKYPQTMLLKSIAAAFDLDPSEGLIDPDHDRGDLDATILKRS